MSLHLMTSSLIGVLACLLLVSSAKAQIPVIAPEGGGGGDVVSSGGQGDAVDVAVARDPFWPVGYVPKKVKKIPEVKKEFGKPITGVVDTSPGAVQGPLWEDARKKIDIRGVSQIFDKTVKAPKYIAMVAGKLVETGDVVSVKYVGRLYRWRVVNISEEGVSLQKLDVRGE